MAVGWTERHFLSKTQTAEVTVKEKEMTSQGKLIPSRMTLLIFFSSSESLGGVEMSFEMSEIVKLKISY